MLKLNVCRFEYLGLEQRQVIVAEIAIGMDIGASSVKINVLEKLGMRKILDVYIHPQLFYRGQKDRGAIERSELSVC